MNTDWQESEEELMRRDHHGILNRLIKLDLRGGPQEEHAVLHQC